MAGAAHRITGLPCPPPPPPVTVAPGIIIKVVIITVVVTMAPALPAHKMARIDRRSGRWKRKGGDRVRSMVVVVVVGMMAAPWRGKRVVVVVVVVVDLRVVMVLFHMRMR